MLLLIRVLATYIEECVTTLGMRMFLLIRKLFMVPATHLERCTKFPLKWEHLFYF